MEQFSQLICVGVSTAVASGVTGVVLVFSLPFISTFDMLKERMFSVKRQKNAWEWCCSVSGAVAVLELLVTVLQRGFWPMEQARQNPCVAMHWLLPPLAAGTLPVLDPSKYVHLVKCWIALPYFR